MKLDSTNPQAILQLAAVYVARDGIEGLEKLKAEIAASKAVPSEDTVRVLRILEYTGSRTAVEKQIAGSVQGEKTFGAWGGTVTIRAATLGTFPEILEPAKPATDNSKIKARIEADLKAAVSYFPDNSSMREGYMDALQTILDNTDWSEK